MKIAVLPLSSLFAALSLFAPAAGAVQDERDTDRLEGLRPPAEFNASFTVSVPVSQREEVDWEQVRDELQHVAAEERPDPVELLRYIEALVRIEGEDEEGRVHFQRAINYASAAIQEDQENGELAFAFGCACQSFAELFEESRALGGALHGYELAFEQGESEVECTRRALEILYPRVLSSGGEDEGLLELGTRWIDRALEVDDEAYLAIICITQLAIFDRLRDMEPGDGGIPEAEELADPMAEVREQVFERGEDFGDQLFVSYLAHLFSSGILASAALLGEEQGQLEDRVAPVSDELEDGLEALVRVLEERDYSERTRSEVARGAWLLARALQHPDEPELFEQAREEALHEGYVLEWRILIEGKIAPEHIDDELLEDYLDERDDERAHAVVGFGAFQLGDFERAESEYLEAVDEGGEHWETWVGLGLTLLRAQGDAERALEALERAEDDGVSELWEEDLEFLLEVARGRIERGAGDGLRPQPTPLRSRCS